MHVLWKEDCVLLFEVTDDSGFLAIYDPEKYSSFVDEDWEFDQLLNHFVDQINKNHLLVWATGSAGTWKVEIGSEITDRQGFRQLTGFINILDNRLCLANYETLTMAAQFSDVRLPEPHLNYLTLPLNNGFYRCRIVQLFDPNSSSDSSQNVDFAIELEQAQDGQNNWITLPWFIR